MAEDVDSWEELIKDTPDGLGDRSNVPNSTTKKTDLSYSSALNKNLPAAPKILARNAVTNSNPAKNIQITFEDNGTRTQFIPQQQQNAKVKILQRPREQNRNDNGTSTIKNGFYNAKTIQEREAEYAKARLRILGANYTNSDDQVEPSSSTNCQPINNQLIRDDNLVRKPQGPTNNNGNFTQRR